MGLENESSAIVFTLVLLVVGIVCLYLHMLDKKGRRMQETEDGKKEYATKYLPDRLKYKSKTVGKANSRQRMSKKERRRINKEQDEE